MTFVVGIDDLGRVVIPIHLRKRYGIAPGSRITLIAESDKISVLPYQAHICVFCGTFSKQTYMGKPVCDKCINTVRGWE